MKKFLISFAFLSLIAAGVSGQSISLTNTFGGNSDNVGTSDFLKFDEDSDKKAAVVGDRIQLDLASEHIDSRVRLNISGDKDFAPAIQGYVNFRPFQPVNIIGGNKFFWKWTTAGAYLAAIDDFLVHGKLADDNGAGIIVNIAPEDKDFGFTFAGAVGARASLDLNTGFQFYIKDTLTLGFTGQDLTTESASFGGYLALNFVKNLILNLGYTYNNTDSGYIQGSQHLAQFSTGYSFEDLPLSLYFDFLSGLNSNSNYNAEAGDYVKLDKGVPLYAAFRANYKFSDQLNLNASVKINHKLNAEDSLTSFTIYPYFDYKTSAGTFRSGIRLSLDDDKGYKGFNIPFSWQYKIAAK